MTRALTILITLAIIAYFVYRLFWVLAGMG